MDNMSIFEMLYPTFKIDKPVRLIELFAGVGSQAMALRNLGVDFTHHKVVEFDRFAIASYNAIHDTEFETADITEVKGQDLQITETDIYIYMLTYSFPCQDLSVAGNMEGMSRDSGTRSGLLWEVERLLNETENLPQVLLMENVPQVISQANIADFQDWARFLEGKGYSNYTDTLNAKDYGVAQNRNRTFMVSILGEYNYTFPRPIPLTKTMKDYLESEVDERFYIDDEKVKQLLRNTGGKIDFDKQVIGTCHKRNDLSFSTRDRVYNVSKNSPTLTSTMYKDAPKLISEREQHKPKTVNIRKIGNINPSGNGMGGDVFLSENLSPTITTNKGEGLKICIEPTTSKKSNRN